MINKILKYLVVVLTMMFSSCSSQQEPAVEEDTCAAFPYDDLKRGHGIPGAFLEAYKTHDSVVEGQIGDFVYTPI